MRTQPAAAGLADALTPVDRDDRADDGHTVDARALGGFLEAEAARLLAGLRPACHPLERRAIVTGHDDSHSRWLGVCALVGRQDRGLADLVVELYCCHGRVVASLQRDALRMLPAATARLVLGWYAAELAERTMAVVEALDAPGGGSSPGRP
ncbi:MAG: hypothetical protein KY434_08550 [Actinobacteria bacterium]|nr:hypothetical protein [Actinomycetota bacterium]